MKNIAAIVFIFVGFALGGMLSKMWYSPKYSSQQEATVLLEKIEAVKKLITVEGQFSEVYSYSDYQGYFTWFFDKKALLRVRATVSAGYDLNQMQFRADAVTHTLFLDAMPEPRILSIDHSLDYYDLSTGLFTNFLPEDYNRMNAQAKEFIREKAQHSNLLTAAREQGVKTLEIIRFMAESAGWKLVIGKVPSVEQH